MPITTYSITNTLATITNGTNIYLQQQITTTHVSSITKTINRTGISYMPLDGWAIFGSIATVISAVAMIVTVYIMYQGNKISAKSSADSIHEMRKQYKQQKKDTQYREDKKELREQIEKYLIPKVEYSTGLSFNVPRKDSESFNTHSFLYLTRLRNYSLGLFYEDKLIEISNKVRSYFHIINSPEKYSDTTINTIHVLLYNISNNLYKALIDEQVFIKKMNRIDVDINKIEEALTPEEKEKIKLYKAQNSN